MFTINGKTVTEAEWLAAANYAKALEELEAVPAADLLAITTERDEALQRVTAASAHAKGQTATFMINGQPSQDVVATQNHITTLETFRTEAVKSAKAEFVKGLAADKKLAATQVESQQAFVATLSDAQFDEYKKSWDAAPAASLFGTHGVTGAEVPANEPSEVSTLEDIVKMHQRSGMKQDAIEKTDSYRKLTALRAAAK